MKNGVTKHKGTVTLYSKKGEFIKANIYQSKTDRNRIINMWRDLYQKAFIGSFVGIIPNTPADEFNPDFAILPE